MPSLSASMASRTSPASFSTSRISIGRAPDIDDVACSARRLPSVSQARRLDWGCGGQAALTRSELPHLDCGSNEAVPKGTRPVLAFSARPLLFFVGSTTAQPDARQVGTETNGLAGAIRRSRRAGPRLRRLLEIRGHDQGLPGPGWRDFPGFCKRRGTSALPASDPGCGARTAAWRFRAVSSELRAAGITRSWGCIRAAAGCEACSRRPDRSAYPSQTEAHGTAASGSSAYRSSANARENPSPKPNSARIPARSVAMPKSMAPRTYIAPLAPPLSGFRNSSRRRSR
jgi:hypothetical protein